MQDFIASPANFPISGCIGLLIHKPADADSVDIKRAEPDSNDYQTIAANVADGLYIDNTADGGKQYTYIATANNKTGSTDSNPVIATMQTIIMVVDPPPPPPPVENNKLLVGFLPTTKADSLKAPYARTRALVSNGDGINNVLRYKGDSVLAISFVWKGKEFPTKAELPTYKPKLQALAAKILKGTKYIAVIENEPNFNEVNSDAQVYASMLKDALDVFSPLGIKVYTGGLTYWALAAYCYTLYVADGDKDSSKVYEDAHNTPRSVNQAAYNFIVTLMQLLKAQNIQPHFNFHVNIQDKSLQTLDLTCQMAKRIAAGKEVICGECGMSRQNAGDVTTTLSIMAKSINAAIFYDGYNAGNDVSFTKDMDAAVRAFI